MTQALGVTRLQESKGVQPVLGRYSGSLDAVRAPGRVGQGMDGLPAVGAGCGMDAATRDRYAPACDASAAQMASDQRFGGIMRDNPELSRLRNAPLLGSVGCTTLRNYVVRTTVRNRLAGFRTNPCRPSSGVLL